MLPAPLLVVDADTVSRDLLARRLERRGYATVVAGSGDEALAYVASNPVSGCSLLMPGMSGPRSCAASGVGPRLPVLMVAAVDGGCDHGLDLAPMTTSRSRNFPIVLARIRTQLSRRRPRTGCGR
jgi:CheY-like chemotaxis protein